MDKIKELESELITLKKEKEKVLKKIKKEYKELGEKYLVGSIIKYNDYLIKIDSIKNCSICQSLNYGRYIGSYDIIGEYIINKSHGHFNENCYSFHILLTPKDIVKAKKTEKAFNDFHKKVEDLKHYHSIRKDKNGSKLKTYDSVFFIHNGEIVSGTVLEFDEKQGKVRIVYDTTENSLYLNSNQLILNRKQ